MFCNIINKNKAEIDRIIFYVFCLCTFLYLPLTFFSRKINTIIYVLSVLFVVKMFWRVQGDIKNPFLLLFAAFAILIFSSSAWSIDPLFTIIASVKMFIACFFGVVWIVKTRGLSSEQIRIMYIFLIFGFALSCLFLYINYFLGQPLEQFRGLHSATLLAPLALAISMCIWPCIMMLIRYGVPVIYTVIFCLFSFVSIFFADCDTAVVNILFGSIVAIFAYYLKKSTVFVVFFSLIVFSVFSPILGLKVFTNENVTHISKYLHNSSYLERMNIAFRVSQKIIEKPILGYGFHSSRFLPSSTKYTNWTFTNIEGVDEEMRTETIPLHPHNGILELWVELGLIGILFLNLLLIITFLAINKINDKLYGALVMGFFTSVIMTALLSVSIWQTWWVVTVFFVLGLILLLRKIN